MKIALFVDFDNVYSGLRRISGEAAERFSRQPLRWLQWLTEGLGIEGGHGLSDDRRRVLVRRCYLNPVMYQKYRRSFHEAGFEIVDCPPMTATGKTSTDIHLVLDTMDALMDATHFDEFIIFSADADFSPVLRRMRRHDRRTVVFAAGAMSESYKASADRVIDIQTFLRDALQLAPVEDETDIIDHGAMSIGNNDARDDLRERVTTCIRQRVLQAESPVPLPSLAQTLQREIPGLREGQWCGTGSFGNLMRQLNMPDIDFNFHEDLASDRVRLDRKAGQLPAPQAAAVPPQNPGLGISDDDSRDKAISPGSFNAAAEAIVQRALADATGPVHLATLGQLLRRELPQLGDGWAGSLTLAVFLQQLHIEPLQRAVLENGTTVVLYDPARHDAPTGVVGDKLIVGMLRAAELPEMRAADLVGILMAARPHMGGNESFEISHVSRDIVATLATQGVRISPRRVATVLQALIFGGLDASIAYAEEQDLVIASMGVILSAWSRETQAVADDEARTRLVAWLALTPEKSAQG